MTKAARLPENLIFQLLGIVEQSVARAHPATIIVRLI